jgi:glucoamylase
MIPYAHFLLDRGWATDVEYVERHLYNPTALRRVGSVIKNDLEEVGGGWWLESFDLWEEVYVHDTPYS